MPLFNFKPRIQLLLILIGSLLFARPVAAWESDVHYGLTLWLAKQAGFSGHQALWIAQGNQGVDDSSTTDPVKTTFLSACSGSDPTGSSEVHDHHFPSLRGAPGNPQTRIVVPGQVQRGGFRQPAPTIADDESSFRDLGKYLHALQDSWSHQGVPDFPDPPCDRQLGWGHSFSRGGWSCHLADLTYMWPDTDARETAKATYETFLAQSKGSPRIWDEILPQIHEFVDGRSKWEKHAWFLKQGFNESELDFLQEISLPDCRPDAVSCPGPYPFQRLIQKWTDIVRASFKPSDDLVALRTGRDPSILGFSVVRREEVIPTAYMRVFRELAAALVAQSSSVKNDLINHVLSRVALARAVRIGEGCPQVLDSLRELMLGSDVMHGKLPPQPIEICIAAHRASLAGSNEISCDAASSAIRNLRSNRNGPSLSEMLPAVQATGLPPYVFGRGVVAFPEIPTFGPPLYSSDEDYSVPVRFAHLPKDVLILTARSVRGTVQIVSANWMPYE